MRQEISRTVQVGIILLAVLLTVLDILNETLLSEHAGTRFYGSYNLTANTTNLDQSSRDIAMVMRIANAPSLAAKPKTATPPYSPFSGGSSVNSKINVLNNGVSSPDAKQQALHSLLSPTQQPAGPVAPKSMPTAPNTGVNTGVGSSATGTVAPFAATSAGAPSGQDQFLAQDAQYLDAQNAAQSEYDNLIAQLAQQLSQYQTGINTAYRNLGYDPTNGQWNQQDRLTAYGNAFNNQQGDFASRGLLDSSLYGSALNDLNRGFNQQQGDLATALQQFQSDQAQQKASAKTTLENAKAAAQRQALQRYAMGLM